jgi:NodT family efflux transporter outer membrane factor (OMF) lipoprotein
MKRIFSPFYLFIIILSLTGCASATDRDKMAGVSLPETFHPSTSSEKQTEAISEYSNWWEGYENSELNALMLAALSNNPDLIATKNRLEQAAADAGISFSSLLPELTTSLSRETSNGNNEAPSLISFRGAASYELDLWGHNYALYQSDKAKIMAGISDVKSARITLSATLAESWINLMATREEHDLLKNQIETNDMILELQHKRYEKGAAEALDVLQQKEFLERSKTGIPDLLSMETALENQLATLAGLSPLESLNITTRQLPEILVFPDSGIPAQLIQNRPDIKAAWNRLASADWVAEAARVNRFPQINLSADYLTSSGKFKNLFSEWALELALGLTAPIIDGGRRANEQTRALALADERYQNYKKLVLSALKETEDAIIRNVQQENKNKFISEQLKASRSALAQAQISYSRGGAGYISVLSSLLNVQSLEQQLIRGRRDLALFRIELYRALGLEGLENSKPYANIEKVQKRDG